MSFPTQNNNINSEARDCCGYDECERPMCDECEECCIGSAVCTRCETDYCTECEVGGDDGTPEQEWVCDACLEEIADCEKCDDGKPCYICCCDKAETTDDEDEEMCHNGGGNCDCGESCCYDVYCSVDGCDEGVDRSTPNGEPLHKNKNGDALCDDCFEKNYYKVSTAECPDVDYFDTLEEAKLFCDKHDIDYGVIMLCDYNKDEIGDYGDYED